MNLQKELRTAISTGKVAIGRAQVVGSSATKKAKLVITAKNCEYIDQLKGLDAPLYEFKGDSAELGSICKKPFAISALAVIEEGESRILSAKHDH